MAGIRSSTGVDRSAKSCGTFAADVVVVLPTDVDVGGCALGRDVPGVDAGPASGWS
jgi:hypothetical protein